MNVTLYSICFLALFVANKKPFIYYPKSVAVYNPLKEFVGDVVRNLGLSKTNNDVQRIYLRSFPLSQESDKQGESYSSHGKTV